MTSLLQLGQTLWLFGLKTVPQLIQLYFSAIRILSSKIMFLDSTYLSADRLKHLGLKPLSVLEGVSFPS